MQISESDIFGVTENVWASVLELAVQPCPVWAAEGEAGALVGRVDISGAWHGRVILACPGALAREVASVIFGVSAEEASTTQAREALAELTNMTAGNLKALLPEPCELGIPVVSDEDPANDVAAGASLVTEAGFNCQGYPFLVKVVEKDAT